MTHFRIDFRKLVGLSLWLLVMLSSRAAFAQPKPGQVNDEGLSSYIFSPGTVTVVLVLLLVAQLVYRNRSRRRPAAMAIPYNSPMMPIDSLDSDQSSKKRYDREELSKLLKASASTKNNGRSLEEAIRLSQVAQDDLLDLLDVRLEPNDGAARVVEPDLQEFEDQEQFLKAESQSVEVESRQEIETSK